MTFAKDRHLIQFKSMLDFCGLEYTENSPATWSGYNHKSKEYSKLKVKTMIVVTGHFYDELFAFFDDADQLITMESHVVSGMPSGRVEELMQNEL
jgi:hypothetical protein